MEIKTLKQARARIDCLERMEAERTKVVERLLVQIAEAKESARLAEEKYTSVIERADVRQEYDTLFDALSEYQCYGWTDRLDLALRMTR